MDRHLKAIELDKVLLMLSKRACNDDAREIMLSLLPEKSLALAQDSLKKTEEAYLLLARFGGPSFGGLKNVNNSLARAASGGVLSMKELLDIGSTARAIRSLSEWRRNSGQSDLSIDVYFNSLMPNKFLEEQIFSAILSEDEMSDNASPELSAIRRKIKNCENNIRDRLDKAVRSQTYKTYLQDAIITQRNGRFVVPVKAEFRANVPGMVHDTSSTGSTVFVEPAAVVELNNEIRVLRGKEQQEIERILYELSQSAGGFKDEIKGGYECALEINVIFSKAQLAYSMKASVPIINNEGKINLKKARHPLIDEKKVVSTDISLGYDFDTLVITGPNTGGKTVAIKTVGLLCAMACCGLMIPAADGSSVSVFDNILADIGDEQSIEQSLSTFSSHMVNIVNILSVADGNSLVLIDELGAGTDPVEGAALATAILERLHMQGAKVAATTHYAELKEYALSAPRVENGSCEFDVNTLRPTYRLILGIPGRSNAFAISERLGIDGGIINRAKELVSTENTRFEDVVDRLTESRLELEKEREKAQEISKSAEEAKERAQKTLLEAESRRDKELENAKGEALRIVEQARREANALLFEVDKLKKEAKASKDINELASRAKRAVNARLNAIDDAVNPVVSAIADDEDYTLPRELKPGDTVFCKTIGKNATVVSVKDKKNNVEISAGMLKMKVPEDSLRLVETKKDEKKGGTSLRPKGGESRATMQVSNRCDLRGLMCDEAILVLDRFIDDMLMSGLKEFTVIHGKGTGALRAAVQQFLKHDPRIKSFRLGTFGEGENGVTIAEIK
ncbi:MAG: endonuclease MutS2 [Oscillospiraceae bacterium]|nr:endonuclease MutS2 [Oscillospiraceae bacterium]MDD7470021.1 endonuclease MutS2 [Oscillospiraceae bacterium]